MPRKGGAQSNKPSKPAAKNVGKKDAPSNQQQPLPVAFSAAKLLSILGSAESHSQNGSGRAVAPNQNAPDSFSQPPNVSHHQLLSNRPEPTAKHPSAPPNKPVTVHYAAERTEPAEDVYRLDSAAAASERAVPARLFPDLPAASPPTSSYFALGPMSPPHHAVRLVSSLHTRQSFIPHICSPSSELVMFPCAGSFNPSAGDVDPFYLRVVGFFFPQSFSEHPAHPAQASNRPLYLPQQTPQVAFLTRVFAALFTLFSVMLSLNFHSGRSQKTVCLVHANPLPLSTLFPFCFV